MWFWLALFAVAIALLKRRQLRAVFDHIRGMHPVFLAVNIVYIVLLAIAFTATGLAMHFWGKIAGIITIWAIVVVFVIAARLLNGQWPWQD